MEKKYFVNKCGMVLFLMFFSLSSVLFSTSGCSDSDSSSSKTQTLVAGSAWSDDDGARAIASVTRWEADIENATLTVNDVSMSYGLPLEFVTDSGLNVKVILPIYYADLGQLTSGDTVDFVAKNPVGNVLYQHTAVTIPDKATILQPVEGASINVNEDVTIQWNEGTNAEGYVVGYLDTGNSDAETTDDDAGTYTEYVGASTTEETVPSTYTVAGDATFSVDAVSGDTDIFTSEEDTTESFFIVGTSDWIEAKIATDVTAAPLAAENQPAEDRASQGLKIVKEYKKKIEGLRFKMRECDPNQIQSSGAVTVRFKLRGSYRLAIAFVALYDMNGNQYASWSKKRQKRKSKKYSHTFSSVQPGTTVVFGTHAASYRGGTYSY